jgi:hypothetical protein
MKVEMNEFEQAGQEQSRAGLFAEYWAFLCHNKKWWLLPILVILLLFGVLLFFSGSAAAPFIYTLF